MRPKCSSKSPWICNDATDDERTEDDDKLLSRLQKEKRLRICHFQLKVIVFSLGLHFATETMWAPHTAESVCYMVMVS